MPSVSFAQARNSSNGQRVRHCYQSSRLHDPHAIPPLREALDTEYRSIRAGSARALGSLGDVDAAPELVERLGVETDKGLKMAYYNTGIGDWDYEILPLGTGIDDKRTNIVYRQGAVPWVVALGYASDDFNLVYLRSEE